MATKSKFKPGLQVPFMGTLQSSGLISELKVRKNRKGNFTWTFRINYIEITGKNVLVKRDFSRYLIKVMYKIEEAPKVFIEQPEIKCGQAPHMYKDNSLCLYKPTLWQWKNEMSFAIELFPTVCLWIYFYEIWQQTGIWYGEEAKHDTPPTVLAEFHEYI